MAKHKKNPKPSAVVEESPTPAQAQSAPPGEPPAKPTEPAKKPPAFLHWKALVFAVVGGLLLPLAYPKFDLFPIAFLALVPLFPIAEEGNKKQAFFYGWVAGILTNFLGYSFLTITLTRFGGLSDGLATLGHVLLAAYQGLRTGFLLLGINVAKRKGWPLWASGIVVMVALEFLMPFIFTFHLGNALYLWVPYIQIADLSGVYLVSAAVFLGNILVYELLKIALKSKPALLSVLREPKPAEVEPKAQTRRLVALVGAQAFVLAYGLYRVSQVEAAQEAAEPIKLGLIQPNFGIDDKGKEKFKQTQYEDQVLMSQQVAQQKPDLIIWPETSYPYAFEANKEAALATLQKPGQAIHEGYDIPVLFGAVTINRDEKYNEVFYDAKAEYEAAVAALKEAKKGNGDINAAKKRVEETRAAYKEIRPDIYNSAWLTTADGQVQGPYHKNFLVWFSEVLPFSEVFPFIDKLFPNGSNFMRGNESVLFSFKGQQIAPNICNDDIMPAMTNRLAGKPANLLINITNDAWFGDTSEPYFHLALATFRSTENHLYMVRATNTGVSALIDATGRILDQTEVTLDKPTLEPWVWEAKFMPSTETVYRMIGNTFAYLCMLLSLAFFFVRRPQEKSK